MRRIHALADAERLTLERSAVPSAGRRDRPERDRRHHDRRRVLRGAALGEVRALRWRDVDFARRSIFVRRNDTGGVDQTPKPGKVRSVPMPPAACVAPASTQWWSRAGRPSSPQRRRLRHPGHRPGTTSASNAAQVPASELPRHPAVEEIEAPSGDDVVIWSATDLMLDRRAQAVYGNAPERLEQALAVRGSAGSDFDVVRARHLEALGERPERLGPSRTTR